MKRMTFNRRRQEGSMGSYIMFFLAFGAILTMGLRLGPLYMDHGTMAGVLDGIAQEPGVGNQSDGRIYELIQKRFKLNNIRDFSIGEHIKIERSGKGTEVVMEYEVRMPLIHNLDLVASFDKKALLRN